MTIVALTNIQSGPNLVAIQSGPVVQALYSGPQTVGVAQLPANAATLTEQGLALVKFGLLNNPLILKSVELAPNSSLTIDVSLANTFEVTLTQAVTSVQLVNFPQSGLSERVTVYLRQDSVGGHQVSGWESQVRWQAGKVPPQTLTPNGVDCLVFDSIDGGNTVLGNIVGLAYA